jgi:hypothetical protein
MHEAYTCIQSTSSSVCGYNEVLLFAARARSNYCILINNTAAVVVSAINKNTETACTELNTCMYIHLCFQYRCLRCLLYWLCCIAVMLLYICSSTLHTHLLCVFSSCLRLSHAVHAFYPAQSCVLLTINDISTSTASI